MSDGNNNAREKEMKKRTDYLGREWTYCDCEGTWTHHREDGSYIMIGCAAKNGRKFSVWNGDSKYPEEFKTLKECIESAR